MNILTIHYNTPELTEALVRSVRKHHDCKIYVFDNSDRKPFINWFPNVEVIDNTKGQFIDLDGWLSSITGKARVSALDNYGSARHTKSVDVCFDLISEGFILLDSDVLLRRDISCYWDESVALSGEVRVSRKHAVNIPRLWPFICYLNVPMLKRNGIRYCNDEKMWFLTEKVPNKYYDTGAWVLEECERKGLPRIFHFTKSFVVHYGRGSKRGEGEDDPRGWLNKYSDLWRY